MRARGGERRRRSAGDPRVLHGAGRGTPVRRDHADPTHARVDAPRPPRVHERVRMPVVRDEVEVPVLQLPRRRGVAVDDGDPALAHEVELGGAERPSGTEEVHHSERDAVAAAERGHLGDQAVRDVELLPRPPSRAQLHVGPLELAHDGEAVVERPVGPRLGGVADEIPGGVEAAVRRPRHALERVHGDAEQVVGARDVPVVVAEEVTVDHRGRAVARAESLLEEQECVVRPVTADTAVRDPYTGLELLELPGPCLVVRDRPAHRVRTADEDDLRTAGGGRRPRGAGPVGPDPRRHPTLVGAVRAEPPHPRARAPAENRIEGEDGRVPVLAPPVPRVAPGEAEADLDEREREQRGQGRRDRGEERCAGAGHDGRLSHGPLDLSNSGVRSAPLWATFFAHMAPDRVADVLAVVAAGLLAWRWRHEARAWTWIDRAGAAVLAPVLVVSARVAVRVVVGALGVDWNGARLAPTVALARGYRLYYPASEGPVLDTIYGPVAALAYLPVALFRSPTPAILAGAALNLAFVTVPLLVFGLRAAGRGAGAELRVITAWLGICLLMTWLPGPYYWLSMTHADGPTLALGLFACAAILPRAGEKAPDTARLAFAATLATLSAWAKQTSLLLGLSLLPFVGWVYGRGPAMRYALSLVVVGLASVGVFSAVLVLV